MSVQSLNGDSYQGAQVGANVQSQVGTSHCASRGTWSPEPSVLWALPGRVGTYRFRGTRRYKP